MATFLYRLGRGAFRRRGWVIVVWLGVLAAVVVGAAQASGPSDEEFSMPGIESQKAFDLMEERFPGAAADGATAQVVFVAPDGQKATAGDLRKAVEDAVGSLGSGPQVANVADPFASEAVSKDGSTAYATVTYKVESSEVTDASRAAVDKTADQARAAGLTVETGGSAMDSGGGPGGVAEIVGLSAAAVVLLFTFGSLAAAGLPLLTAIVGVAVSLFGILLLAGPLGLSADTLTLGMMLGLAVGIDYALFVVSRYREERGRGRAPQDAAGVAVGTAGSAVVFAGVTVVIALAGLSVVGIPTLTKMGLAAAGAVVVAVLVALTVVPALLGYWPNAVLARRARKADTRYGTTGPRNRATGRKFLPTRKHSARTLGSDRAVLPSGGDPGVGGRGNLGTRWARFVLRRPVAVLVLGVLGLGALAVPMASLQLGMPGDEAKSTATTERRAYDALAEGFGPGFNGPLTIVVDTRGTADPHAAVRTVSDRIGGTDAVVSVSQASFNQAGDTAVFRATPSTSPTDKRTKALVETIRRDRPAVEEQASATFEVTGTTALNIDVAAKVQSALVPYLTVVGGLAVVLLLVVFRSVLVPIKAALGFVLSVLAALGVLVLVFQQGHAADLFGVEQTGPIMSLMPIFMMGIVFGLAMDYEVFLVSRIREAYTHGEAADQALVSGFRHSARVVTAAALIMIAVFSGFIGEQGSMIKMLGFGLAAAVLFDAFVVRMAIVPAVLALLGDRAWWLPVWLGRALPRVDVEGEALGHARSDRPAPGPDGPVEAHV
ncbi:MMPL family transporter [Streptomyces zagrosensis]|uniref:RND superfamily putative drug exporter n=1 Tax=Streptomyces zagrosensis TaxID=1042984 RepID=A0A7W9QB77_9ACTN|nr:MMPL family transporter [Streptomyces zagrosensis]MBB5936934.1 RND superfamily putative drug exporter [Streptomyces zagrosensis]